jgi:hypothetical protein
MACSAASPEAALPPAETDATAAASAPGSPGASDESGMGGTADPSKASAAALFTDQSQALGLDFVHVNGMTDQRRFPEINGPGSALFDYDGDGDLDLYLVQGGSLESGPDPAVIDRLYRNRLVEDGMLSFEDVTAESGIVASGYGMGVAAGDIDNDGDLDLYLCNFGPNQLWMNQGDGSFEDVTQSAGDGLEDERWSTSAAFVDFDRDGWLDLILVNYTDYSLATHKDCYAPSGAVDYCGPLSYEPLPDRLMRNRGDGSFEDVTASAGLGAHFGAALGVVAADFDADGWPDLYVTNDGMDNQLWMNQGGQRFENRALLAGVALSGEGVAQASMGVSADDFDADGDFDLFMTHLTDETNTYYVNEGPGLFADRSQQSGLGGPSLALTGFGLAAADFDSDGWLDIVVANGGVRVNPRQAGQAPTDDPLALYRQPGQLFRNLGEGRFEERPDLAGPDLAAPVIARGLSSGDIDNDGDIDLVIDENRGPARLLLNQAPAPARWLGLRLIDHGRDAYGALIAVEGSAGTKRWLLARADGSHLSSNDPRARIVLPAGEAVRRVEVRWPEGQRESWDLSAEPGGRYIDLIAGQGLVE